VYIIFVKNNTVLWFMILFLKKTDWYTVIQVLGDDASVNLQRLMDSIFNN